MRSFLANWIWLLLFGVLATGFIIGGWSASNQIPSQQQGQRSSAAHGKSEPQPAVVSEQHAEQGRAQTSDKKEPHGGGLWTWVSNFFEVKLTDLLIAIFTVVLAVKTSGLFRETAGLRSAADKQAIDMQASIAAATEANRISSEGFHASQRAWVTEETVTASDLVWNKHGCELVVKTKVENIGIAPAQEVVVEGKIVATTKGESEYKISDALNEPPSMMVGHLLFPSADFAPSKRLKLTREQIDKVTTADKEVTIKVVVIVRYLSTMDRKSARTIRFYDLKRLPVIGKDISYPLPIRIDDDVPQGMLVLTHHWMPSYAD